MANTFTDNPDKGVVRESWDTPILRYLSTQYSIRYRYMGLPGVKLLDLRMWKDMIDEVVAFEPPDESADRRQAIVELRKNLQIYGFRGIAYYGSLEEVVLLKRDFEGTTYSQKGLITLYNFDFCDEIASPISTQTRGEKVLRFHAIRQVLRDQAECYRLTQRPNYFFLLLTIRNQIGAAKIKSFLNKQLLAQAKEFYDRCRVMEPLPTKGALLGNCPWALKTFLFDLLSQNFTNPNLSAIFLPVVFYLGTPVKSSQGQLESPMMHWVVLCKFGSDESHGTEILPQSFLPTSSVTVSNKKLIWKPLTGEARIRSDPPNSVQWLCDYGAQFLQDLSN